MANEIIVTESLRKEYFEVVAVNDVSLAIPAGEILGLIGPNGAGKTTLLRMLATCLEPTSGRIRFEGDDIWRDPQTIRGKMGFMPDFFQMYDRLLVREVLTYFAIAHGLPRCERSARVDEVLRLTGLEEKKDSLAKGLSRGMTQRLGLGRAILHRPRVLLLDEPASGLDPLARRDLFNVLTNIHADGTTILISSHILGELSELCTSVGIMHDGRFLEIGPTAEVIRKIMPKRQIGLRLTSGLEQATKLLAANPLVSGIVADGSNVRFAFDGQDADMAALNAQLVAAGAGVAMLQENRASLHEVYFAIAERDANAQTN